MYFVLAYCFKTVRCFLFLQQQSATSIYTGTPFPSVIHSNRGQKRGHYTPRPLLNPLRQGTGLFSSLSLPRHEDDYTAFDAEEEECGVTPWVITGDYEETKHCGRQSNPYIFFFNFYSSVFLYSLFHSASFFFSLTRCVNVGHQFQAELPPPRLVESDVSVIDVPVQESSREQLLWKPWEELEESHNLHNQGKCHA